MCSIRNMKLNKKLAACAIAGTIGLSLAAAANPASAAVVKPAGAHNSTVTNNWSLNTLIGTAYTTTLQTNQGWNGSSIVQYNWLKHSENIAPWEAAVYLTNWSSFGHYYSGGGTNFNLIDWGNYAFVLAGIGDSFRYYCVYMRTITNEYGYTYTQDWGQGDGYLGGKC
jgi:hypothetical protein